MVSVDVKHHVYNNHSSLIFILIGASVFNY